MSGRDNKILVFGNCRLDPGNKLLWYRDEPVPLPLKSIELLCLLVDRAGDVVPKDDIWNSVWQGSFVEETNLTHNIYLLRKTLKELGEGDLIQTVPRRGYRFTAGVREGIDGNLMIERRSTTETLIEELPEPVSYTLAQSGSQNRPASRPYRLVAAAVGILLIAGAFLMLYNARSGEKNLSLAGIRTIAVLPFVNGSPNSDLEFMTDGMTESLISNLSQVTDVAVKAPDSVFRYKGKDVSLRNVADELNVQAVLKGRLVQQGDRLIVYLTMVDVETENVIWGKQYDRTQTDLLLLQSEIARDVLSSLKTDRSDAAFENLARVSTQNTQAYEQYLRGRHHWNKRNPADLQRSIEYFQQAIALDPTYAYAYAGLATAYPYLASYGNMSPLVLMPKARDAALKAIELDDGLAEAHTALGLILHGFDHDYSGSEREYRLAIEKNPNYAHAHQLYGELLDCLGRHDEAEAEFRKALELDPLSLIVNRMYGEHLFYAGRYDEAIGQLKRTIELDPNFYTAHASLAYVYQVRGEYHDAAEEFARTHEALGEADVAKMIRESFAGNGWRGFLQYMTSDHRPKTLPMFNVAIFHAELGEKERALSILSDLYENRNYLINWLTADPRMRILRDEPQFKVLVEKLDLTPSS